MSQISHKLVILCFLFLNFENSRAHFLHKKKKKNQVLFGSTFMFHGSNVHLKHEGDVIFSL